jgi:hypothetical protein
VPAPAEPKTREPALIAAFYAESRDASETLAPLQATFCQVLNLTRGQSHSSIDYWRNLTEGARLYRFDPVQAHDATVLQTLPAPLPRSGPVCVSGWKTFSIRRN